MSKFRFTGGEPLIRREIVPFLGRVKRIPGVESLAVSTNGLLLAQHAEGLRDAGVDKLNISVDSFDRATFAKLTRRDVLPTVLAGLEAATRSGAFTIKLNAVLLRGINDHELAGLPRRLDPDELARPVHRVHAVRRVARPARTSSCRAARSSRASRTPGSSPTAARRATAPRATGAIRAPRAPSA